MAKAMKMYEIPDEVRQEGEGDEGKCGGCNWPADRVYMMGVSQEGANDAFRENRRGLCGLCMTELLQDGDYQIHSKVEARALKRRAKATKKRSSFGARIRGLR